MSDPVRRGLQRLADLLAGLDEARLPKITVILLGVIGAGIGLIFLLRPGALRQQPSLVFLLSTAPPVLWGTVFFGVGVALATAAIIDHTRAYALCGLMSVALFAFTGLSAAGVVSGFGSGLLAWTCLGLGTICSINALTIYAPRLKGLIL